MKTLEHQHSDFIQEKYKKCQWKTVPIFDYSFQKQEIAKLRKRNTKLLSIQQKISSNEISNKIITSTKLSMISAKSNENPALAQKHLKLQLHQDKHPKELRWLFDELFKLINV